MSVVSSTSSTSFLMCQLPSTTTTPKLILSSIMLIFTFIFVIVPRAGGVFAQSADVSCVVNCAAGYYNTSAYNSTCVACPVNYKCAGGVAVPVACAAGEESTGGTSICTQCGAVPNCGLGDGQGCPADAKGYYASGAGPYTCVACTAGTYQPANGAPLGSCTPAAAGTYVNAARDGTLPCTAGYACPSKTVDKETACAAGTYSDDGSATGCQACEAGYACPSTSLQCTDAASSRIRYACNPGSYSTGSQQTCTLCPEMHFCPDPTTATVTPCPTGTWSTLGQSNCSVCPLGLACRATGTYACAVGEASNFTHCTPCPKGFHCGQAGLAVACSAGTYATGSATQCTVCPAGSECPRTDSAPISCQEGFYSVGAALACDRCNATSDASGVALYTTGTGSTSCTVCPAGSYCPNSYSAPVVCPRGFAAGGGNFSCTSCSVLYPTMATYTAADGSADCVICPAGYYCPAPDQSPNSCPVGSYSTGGSFNCTLCPRGSECPTPTSAPIACPGGSYAAIGYEKCRTCPANSQCPSPALDPIPCNSTEGYFSTPGSSSCQYCTPGTSCIFNVTNGSSIVQSCEPGTYRTTGLGCAVCPVGYMCPVTDGNPILCPIGSYSWYGSTTCFLCPAGMRCANETAPLPCPLGTYSYLGESQCSVCPAGWGCRVPWGVPVPCKDGTYSEGASTNCTRCPNGWACPSTSQFVNSSFRCALGSYSAGGQLSCTLCRPGHYCPSIYEAVEIYCPSGYTSAAGQSNCTICPVGYYCPSRDYTLQPPIPCPVGSFSTGAQTSCDKCPAGFACPSTTQQTLVACPNGTWTTQGMPACAICKPGHYCPQTAVDEAQPLIGPVGVGREVPCPLGTYSVEGAVECTKCPRGFYCIDPASSNGNASTCAAGTFTAIGDVYSEFGATNCAACPSGADCSVSGDVPTACSPGTYATTSGCLSCPGGYFCETASSIPVPCPAGQYSSNNSITCTSCTAGFACPPMSTTPTPAGNECPLGSYCPTGAAVAVPCPAGSYGTSTGAGTIGTGCAQCVAGKYCPLGTAGVGAQVACPAGHYCPNGAGFAAPCPGGTYSASTSATSRATCKICPEGYFCPSGSFDFTANPCPAGYFCPAGTAGGYDNGCPPGTFSSDSKLSSVMQCQQCPVGHSCPSSGLNSALSCNIGAYQDLPGQTACKSCEAGWACPRAGLSTYMSTTCSPGHFCPRGTGLPTSNPCPGGSYTFRKNLQEAGECEICWRGFYCPPGTGSNPLTPQPCAAGHYCPGVPKEGRNPGTFFFLAEYFGNSAAISTQYPCPSGSFSSATDLWAPEQCTDCLEGSFCVGGGAAVSGQCAAGHFCPRGSAFAQQVPCPPGTWKSSTGTIHEGDCLPCQPGFYCPAGSTYMISCPQGTYTPFNRTHGQGPAIGLSDGQCILCPAGYACSVGSTTPVACTTGTYSGSGSAVCRSCEGGRYCPQNATTEEAKEKLYLCPAGLFCSPGLARLPSPAYDLCSSGHYCPVGAVSPVACPPGTMNPATGRTSITECLLCPAGYYCSATAAINATGECSPGYYCPLGSTAATQEPCPGRFFRSSTRAESEDFCQACPKGSYCPPGTATPLPCPMGYYCPCGTNAPVPCPIGTYGNSSGLYTQTQCSACTPGYYCDGLGLQHPTGLCDPGYYCVSRAFTSAPPGLPTGGKCPKGGYCPAGSAFPTACAEGTFNNFTGGSTQQDCTTCTPGYYCAGSNLPFPTGPCAAGYYCTGGASTPTQFRTPSGHFSLPGAPSPEPCPLGTYNPLPAQGSCLACVKGNYCPNTGLVNYLLCPAGSYCPPASVTPKACPLGTFQPELSRTNITQCINCLPGFYCAITNNSKVSGPCSPGFYCKRACINAECSLYLTNYQVYNNLPANPGIENAIGGQCPYGNYCPNATAIPISCAIGTVRDAVQGTSNTSCQACPTGYYCPLNGMSFNLASPQIPSPCTPGYYCPGALIGSDIGCSDSQCATYHTQPCDLEQFGCHGTTNVDLASTTPAPRLCPSGFSCPTAAGIPQRCMPLSLDGRATWNPLRGKASCEICPMGYYCDYNNVTTLQVAISCPAGRYCPPGTGGIQPLCPEGSWSDVEGLTNRSFCHRCPAGRFCPNKGIDNIATASAPFCFGGYFCTSGALDGFGRWSVLGGLGGICPMGYYCPNGTKFNTSFPCPPGSYKPTLGGSSATSCIACPSGKYCNGTAQIEVSGDCQGGFYCPRSCADPTCANRACTLGVLSSPPNLHGGACPAGHYCPPMSGIPTPCPAGTYQPAQGQISCLQCPAGFHCGGGYIYPSVCPRGHYCPNGTSSFNIPKCPRGSYRDMVGGQNVTDCNLCAPGRYCPYLGMNASLPLCASGYYCAAGAMDQYGNAGELGGDSGICHRGYYCPRGTPANNSFPCPPGTFNSKLGQHNYTACLACTGGFACIGWSVVDPTLAPCSSGFYCPQNCSDVQCTNKMCMGSCAAPWFGGICPVGHHCPMKNITVYRSWPGDYASSLKLSGAVYPTPCPNGTYAPTQGLSECLLCPPRGYCPFGTVFPLPCPAGYYCPGNTSEPLPCPVGSYQPNENSTICLLCSGGSYCVDQGLMNVTGPCAAGYYCASGAATSNGTIGTVVLGGDAGLCPIGHYCPTGTNASKSFPCSNGTYNPDVGAPNSSHCRPCDAGMYCPSFGQNASLDACAPGYFCPRGCADETCSNMPCFSNCADYANSPYLQGGVCPAGFYCPQQATNSTASGLRGAILPVACPPGTWGPVQGLSTCLGCPAGKFCGTATVNATACPLGRYCPENTSLVIPNCPEGSFNDQVGGDNISSCVPCLSGRYCARRGNHSWTADCAAGYYCTSGAKDPFGTPGPLGGVGGLCSPGHYCPEGSGNSTWVPCPAGTYSTAIGAGNVSGCLSCPPGFFCDQTGQTKVASICEVGYFCRGNCTDAQCSNHCKTNCSIYDFGGPCPLGHACPLNHGNSFNVDTRIFGSIWSIGNFNPQPCPWGTYTAAQGSGECFRCPQGYYCHPASVNPVPQICPAGYYCPDGVLTIYSPSNIISDAKIIPCPNGTYSNNTGLIAVTECMSCPGGQYCGNMSGGLTAPSGLCAPGYFCPGGAATPFGQLGLLGELVNSTTIQWPLNNVTYMQDCPAGYYCPLASAYPLSCPIGTFNPDVNTQNASASCRPCTGGFYCSNGSAINTTGQCAAGYACPLGCFDAQCMMRLIDNVSTTLYNGVTIPQSTIDLSGLCPPGTYCPIQTITPINCPAGTFSDTSGSAYCSPCPAGKYCPANSTIGIDCPRGNYCPENSTGAGLPQCPTGSFGNTTGASNYTNCSLCTGGAACTTTGLITPDAICAAGYYCMSGAADITGALGTVLPYTGDAGICPTGHYCPSGTVAPQPCPAGTFNPVTGAHNISSGCLPCPAGRYCSGEGNSNVTGMCDAGYWCQQVASLPNSTSDLCPRGYYCPRGTGMPIGCIAGTYQPYNGSSSASECIGCPAGWWCSANATEPTGFCDAGYYCPGNNTVQNPSVPLGECPTGMFCPQGSGSPIPCTPGSYCDNVRLALPTAVCVQSYYCTLNSSVPNPTDNITGNICPAGHYCPANSSIPTACPSGTYNSLTGQSSSFSCALCIGGHYCPNPGMTAPGPECDAGYYCPPGQSINGVTYPCPIGSFCPQGSAYPQRCAPGNYSDNVELADCKICMEGYYCNPKDLCNSTNYTSPKPCVVGHYCPAGTRFATEYPCPIGTYSNNTGNVNSTSCTLCSPGLYCPNTGMISDTTDPYPFLCAPGYYCTRGASIGNPTDNITGNICPAGYYCPNGTATPNSCPLGTYSNTVGLWNETQCTPCSPGWYCDAPHLTAPVAQCDAGYFCPSRSSNSQQRMCTYGHVCALGSGSAGMCAAGTYTIGEGSSTCSACLAGKYCDPSEPCAYNASVYLDNILTNYTCPRTCPVGHWCGAGTQVAFQNPCPSGTIGHIEGLSAESECLSCPAGQYCENTGTHNLTTQPCSAGYFCSGGSNVSNPTGGIMGVVCPAGFYCPSGTPNPVPCPIGTYRTATGAQSVNDCTTCSATRACTVTNLTTPDADCQAGYYCPGGAATPNPNATICPIGFYCPSAYANPVPCADGTTALTTGRSTCQSCPLGYFCTLNVVNGTLPEPCPKGHYCPLGTNTSTQYPCPSGTYSDSTGNSIIANCSACPTGSACPATAHVSPLPPCAEGYYCVSGASTTAPTDGVTGDYCPKGAYCPAGVLAPVGCPPGTFSNSTGLWNASQCTPCTAGQYCDSTNLTFPTGVCSGGWYCPPGMTTSAPALYICPAYKRCPTRSVAPINCPNGEYSGSNDTNLASCHACPQGYFCHLQMQQEMPWNETSDYIIPVACPAGYYCPSGTAVPVACPVGTYSNQTGMTNVSACNLCPSGSYCHPAARTAPSGLCAAGYYCSLGSPTAEPADDVSPAGAGGPCPIGRYCVAGSTASMGEPCPRGTFYVGRYAKNVTTCQSCSPGYCCESLGSNSSTGDGACPAGYYCPGADQQCANPSLLCPAGHYCPPGTATPLPCNPGFYQPSTGQSSCLSCTALSVCPSGSINPETCNATQVCPAESAYPQYCKNGTYAADPNVVLSDFSLCVVCPSGKFCVDGSVSGDCAAGYLCEFGNVRPDPESATNAASVKKGGLCPLGHYCESGTSSKQPCTNQTVGFVEGLQRSTDCQPCQPGYYCLESSTLPIECPKGYYCPGFGVTAQPLIPCPRGTFNPDTKATDVSFCQSCEPGFYCPLTAMTTAATFSTPPGFYSARGQTEPYPCPGGTYQSGTNGTAANTSSCTKCPVGYYCGPESAAFNHPCPEGTFCPEGSAYPFHCPGGSYCPHNHPNPIACPEGYFCPALSTFPTLCWNGTYCPASSAAPLICPAGTASRNDTALRFTATDSCLSCPAGTWSSNSLWCEPCSPGYVCLGGTNVPYPLSIEVEKGYICPVGYYCPTGSSAPTPCPPGRYNNRTGGRTINACFKCNVGFYNPDFAQTGCRRCGKSATSASGSSGCDCIGRNRVFQADDGSCRCRPSYVFYADGQQLSEEDSSFSCQPIVFPRCPPGEFRSAAGTCIQGSESLLCEMCPNKKGAVDTQIGVCSCDELQSEDEICDAKCQNTCNKVTIDSLNKRMILTNRTDGTQIIIELDSAAAIGRKNCGLDRTTCDVKMMLFGPEGTKGVYNPTPSLFLRANTTANVSTYTTTTTTSAPISVVNARIAEAQALGLQPSALGVGSSARRSLQGVDVSDEDARTLSNPIVCLNLGETMMFDVSDSSRDHYPVYVKDSLLNTNAGFDYTAFRELGEKMKAANLTLSVFLYSFDAPGVYVFADNANRNLITIIRVVTINEKCPTSTFMAVTQGSMVQMSVSRDPNILLEPDWILIGVLSGGMLILVTAVIGGLYYFRSQSWDHISNLNPDYRETGKSLLEGEASKLASKGTNMLKTQLLANKEERMPVPDGSSNAITLRLDEPFRGFDAETFAQRIADEMEISSEYVLVVSVTEGSTIVRFVFQKHANAQELADQFVNRLHDDQSVVHDDFKILAFDAPSSSSSPSRNNNASAASGSAPSGFSMAEFEDEFWDYERQIDLEGFNVRTLYDKLEDQTLHVVSQLSNQRDDLLLLCDKILVESEALKDMFLKIKLDIDDRTRSEKNLAKLRDEAMKEGKIHFELPDELKTQVAGFINGFFDRWLLALNDPSRFKNAHEMDPNQIKDIKIRAEYDEVEGMMQERTRIDDKSGRGGVLISGAPAPAVGELPFGVESTADTFDMDKIIAEKRKRAASRFASKTRINLSEFPSEMRDDSDDEDYDERLRRGEIREKNLRLKLNRLRRRMDEVTMPLGLSNDKIIPGVTSDEDVARIKEERKAWFAARKKEREHCDDCPEELQLKPGDKNKVKMNKVKRRELQLYKRVRDLRQSLVELEIPSNLQDSDTLLPAERETRRVHRNKFINHRIDTARLSRAEATVPLEFCDDSDLEGADRKIRRDAAEDRADTLRTHNSGKPALPDPSALGLSVKQKNQRETLSDKVLIDRAHIAHAAIEELTLPEGLSDHEDLDVTERRARKAKRDKFLAKKEEKESKSRDSQASATTAASTAIISNALDALKHSKIVDGCPEEYLDDPTLTAEDRKYREHLRKFYVNGRSSKADELPPLNENERGISEEERRRRQEFNEAYRRGQTATYGIDAGTLRARVEEMRQNEKALSAAKDTQAALELGREQQAHIELPDDARGNSQSARAKRQAFMTGRRAATVAALPADLDPKVAGLNETDLAERKALAARFRVARKQAAEISMPNEIKGDPELEMCFKLGRDVQRGKAVEDLVDVEEGVRREAVSTAFAKGSEAAKLGALPDEYLHDPQLREAFSAGLNGEDDVPESLGGANCSPKVRAAFNRGHESRLAIDAAMPPELRDDVPMLSQEEIAERRRLQGIFKIGLNAALAEQKMKELQATEKDESRKKGMQNAFGSGIKAQKTADAIPKELSDSAIAALTGDAKKRALKERSAFIRGRAAQHMADAILEDIDPATRIGPAATSNSEIAEMVGRGSEAQNKFDHLPPEMRDATSLPEAERQRRAKLREAITAGRNAKAASKSISELVEAKAQPQMLATQKDVEAARKAKLAAQHAGLAARGAGAGVGGELDEGEFASATAATAAQRQQAAAAGQQGAAGAAGAAGLDQKMLAEFAHDKERVKREAAMNLRKLKHQHKSEDTTVMEELEEETTTASKKLAFDLTEQAQLELDKLKMRQALEMEQCDPSRREALKKEHERQINELLGFHQQIARDQQASLASRGEEKKEKMKQVLDKKHKLELGLLANLAKNQTEEIDELRKQAEMMDAESSRQREHDMAYQRQQLEQKLRAREERMKAKARKEKQFLEHQLQSTETIEKDMKEAELKAKEDADLQRVQELEKRGIIEHNESLAEQEKVKARAAKENEKQMKSLQSRMQATRVELEHELQEKIDGDKQLEAKRVGEEIDTLISKASEERSKADVERREQEEAAKKSKAAQEMKKAADFLAARAAERAEIEKQLAEVSAQDKQSKEARAEEEAKKRIAALERDRGQQLTPEQRKQILEECNQAAQRADAMLADEQRRQEADRIKKLEARRKQLQRRQATEARKELERQESERAKNEADLKNKVSIDTSAVSKAETADLKAEKEQLEEKQRREQEEMARKHAMEQSKMERELKDEMDKEQKDTMERLKAEHLKRQQEFRSKQQAASSASMTQEQRQALREEQEAEEAKLKQQLSAEEAIQKEAMEAKLRARLARKRGDLNKQQNAETKAEHQKEKQERDDTLRSQQLEQEKKIIDATAAKSGAGGGDKESIAQVAMGPRHRAEVKNLIQEQNIRRDQEIENWKKEHELAKEQALASIDERALAAMAQIPSDAEDAEAKRQEIQAKRESKKAKLSKEADAKFASELEDRKDRLEMELVQEQLSIKLRQVSEISSASGIAVPQSVLAQLGATKTAEGDATITAAALPQGPTEEELAKQKEAADRELQAFKQQKLQEQSKLKESLEKKRLEYEAKLKEDLERRAKEQEQEMKDREVALKQKVETEIAARERKVHEQLKRATVGAGGDDAHKKGIPGGATEEQLQELLASGKAEEARLRAEVDKEMARQRTEHEANLKAKRERAAKRKAALKEPLADTMTSESGMAEAKEAAKQAAAGDTTATQKLPSAASAAQAAPEPETEIAAAEEAATTGVTTSTLDSVLAKIQQGAQQGAAQQQQQQGGGEVTAVQMFAPPIGGGPENAAALQQWASYVAQELQVSPLFQKLVNIERMLANQQRGQLLSFYLDAKDREHPATEDKLIEKNPDSLSTDKFVVWFFGRALCSRLASTGVKIPDIQIKLAEALPKPRGSMSAFRYSYFYDANRKTLYVRDTRLETLGEFSIILIHALAHIKAASTDRDPSASSAMWSDTNPRFLEDFYGMLELTAEESFFTRLDNVERERVSDRPYRPGTIMSSKSMKQIEGAISGIPASERDKALHKMLQM